MPASLATGRCGPLAAEAVPGAAGAFDDAPDEGRLANVLGRVAENADETDTESDRRVPVLVHHRVVVVLGQALEEADRPGMHGVVVLRQERPRQSGDLGDAALLWP